MSTTITKTLKVKMNTRRITDFCNDYSIPYIFCRITKHYKTGNKVIEGIPKGVMDMTYDQAMEFNKNVLPTFATHINCILKNGENPDKLMVIDFDDKEDIPTYIDRFGNDWKTKSSSRGLPHLWRLKNENDFSKDITSIKIDDKPTKIDLRYTNIFERIDSNIEYLGAEKDIPIFDFETFHPSPIGEKPLPKEPIQPSEQYTLVMKDRVLNRIKNHLQNINEDYIANDSDWFLVGNAIKSVFSCLGPMWFEILIQWSQLSKKHVYEDTDKWVARFAGEPRCGLSTILNYSKKSNDTQYKIIEDDYFQFRLGSGVSKGLSPFSGQDSEKEDLHIEGKELLMKIIEDYDNTIIEIQCTNGTDTGLAKTYLKIKNDLIIKVDNIFYIYEGRLWSKDEDLLKIQLDVRDTLLLNYTNSLAKITEIKNKTAPDDPLYESILTKITFVNGIIMDIQKQAKQKNIISQILLEIPELNIMMDKIKPYYFVFDNIAFDLQFGNEVQIKKKDYITQSTHYNYIKPSQSKIDEINKLFCEILPNEDYRNCYLSILKSCLTGIKVEKFILANGSGRNGKGIISQTMAVLLGNDYFYQGNSLTLTKELQTGSNVEIANMDNARMICFSEPEEDCPIKLGVIKALTGEDSINARTIYSKKTKTQLSGTIVLEVNGKPNINGKINDSAIERWININFPNCFTEFESLVDNITKFPQNTLYKTLEWKQGIRCALFDILFQIKDNKIFIPKSIRDDTMDYLCNNDQLLKWFEETYDYIEDGKCEHITMQSLFQKFKEGDFYVNLSKKAKREEYTKKGIIDKIKQNVKLKVFFFDKKIIDGIHHTNLITHYRLKEVEDTLTE